MNLTTEKIIRSEKLVKSGNISVEVSIKDNQVDKYHIGHMRQVNNGTTYNNSYNGSFDELKQEFTDMIDVIDEINTSIKKEKL